MLIDLINFDTKSLIGVLVWGNTATGIIESAENSV